MVSSSESKLPTIVGIAGLLAFIGAIVGWTVSQANYVDDLDALLIPQFGETLDESPSVVHRLRFARLSHTDVAAENDLDEGDFDLPVFGENSRPVIGILTQPGLNDEEYIAASYVKYAEAAGARVVPIRYE